LRGARGALPARPGAVNGAGAACCGREQEKGGREKEERKEEKERKKRKKEVKEKKRKEGKEK
jgi:hypothetical protein